MTSKTVDAIAALLERAESAHAVYEATELGGVYDEAWPAWYASYAVAHGVGDLLGRAVTADRMATLLASAFDDFKALPDGGDEPWAHDVARRIAAQA